MLVLNVEKNDITVIQHLGEGHKPIILINCPKGKNTKLGICADIENYKVYRWGNIKKIIKKNTGKDITNMDKKDIISLINELFTGINVYS